jgi:hypothetical protein
MIKVAGGAGPLHGSTTLDYLKVVAELLNSVAWPIAAVWCVVLFRRQLTKFLGDVDTVKVFGAEISRKINTQIEQSALEAQGKTDAELASGPTAGELDRAKIVKQLASDTGHDMIARQAESLAGEYERVRASMPSSDERTRAMEVVVSKMRTIGQAFFPLRHEFAWSPSPGKKLMVIASLEVSPDYEMIDWLAERASSEKPFVQFHALVAMMLAARENTARAYLSAFEAAIVKLSQCSFGGDSSRLGTFAKIKKAVERMKIAVA